jgi:flagellar biosynthesis/type III secretory pathway M-ring protein FliF/YscJ
MAYLLIVIVIAIAVFVVSAPLRAARSSREADQRANRRAELEAARDAKYREIRDAELDLATGKLSDEDYAAIDHGLRREAVTIMHALDEADSAGADSPGETAPPTVSS